MNRHDRRAAAAQARKAPEPEPISAGQPKGMRLPRGWSVFWVLYAAVIGIWWLIAWASEANAHSWYDPSCCSTTDCAPAPVGQVKATRDGWVVEIPPNGHPSVGAAGWTGTFPYGDTRIKESQDSDFHVCIGVASQAGFCLYVPRGATGA